MADSSGERSDAHGLPPSDDDGALHPSKSTRRLIREREPSTEPSLPGLSPEVLTQPGHASPEPTMVERAAFGREEGEVPSLAEPTMVDRPAVRPGTGMAPTMPLGPIPRTTPLGLVPPGGAAPLAEEEEELDIEAKRSLLFGNDPPVAPRRTSRPAGPRHRLPWVPSIPPEEESLEVLEGATRAEMPAALTSGEAPPSDFFTSSSERVSAAPRKEKALLKTQDLTAAERTDVTGSGSVDRPRVPTVLRGLEASRGVERSTPSPVLIAGLAVVGLGMFAAFFGLAWVVLGS